MSFPTFNPPQNPNLGLGYQVKPRVLNNQYGDGYAQRTRDGLNSQPRSFSLSWGPLTLAKADAIEQFFAARGGVEPFFYQTPREADAGIPPRKYVCTQWDRVSPQWNQDQITATFVEDFSLGS